MFGRGVREERVGGPKKRAASRKLQPIKSTVVDIGEYRKKVAAATKQLRLPYSDAVR